MKTLLKNILFASLVAGVVSCSDFLDVDPEGELPVKDFYTTQEHAVQSVNSIYAHQRSWSMVAFPWIMFQSIPSDNASKGSAIGDATFINDFDQFRVTPSSDNSYWGARYEGINLCNQALDNIPAIQMDENLKKRLLGEAKFGRAFYYFDLVRAFGAVPMPLTVEGALVASTIRTPVDEVYAQLIADLTDAIDALPRSYSGNDVGRATEGSARGLLAKVYLYLQEWDKVLEQTTALSQMGYDLIPSFYDAFRIKTENGIESIYEIQAFSVEGDWDLSSCQYGEVQGIRGDQGVGWGFNIPTDDLADAFDKAGDTVRKKVTILYKGDVVEPGDTVIGVAIGELEGVTIPRWNGKAHVPKSEREWGPGNGNQNVRVLRYAEILLIDAEARLNKGDANGAAASLNRVRERVSLPPVTNPTMQDIWNERRLELAMEGDRFYDLVRTGQAASILADKGFVAEKNELFPIPQTVMETTNFVLEQNPGY